MDQILTPSVGLQPGLALRDGARRSPRMKTTMPATPIPVNMNHCTAYQKCGPSESSGSGIG